MKNDWTETVLGEVCEKPQYGFTASAESDPIGPKLLRITDITELGVNWNTVPHCKCPQSTVPLYRLEHNDILVARIGATTGKSFIVKAPPLAVFASYLIRLRVHPEICPDYLSYSLQTADYWSQIRANKDKNLKGGVNATVLSGLALSLPSLPEQKKIATVLLKIQRAIEMEETIIQLLRDLKKSIMQHLFTHGLHGEKTKMTKIGEIPESWKVVQLEQIASIERGKFSHRPRNDPAYYGGHIPFIQTGDITQSNGRIRTYTQTLNQRGLSVSKVFPAGTILITIAANIGDTGILEFDSAFPDSIIGITPSNDLDGEYLEFYLQTQKHKMNLLAPKGTQKNINIEFLKPWPVKLPSVPEQRNIAHAIGSVGRKLEMHESKKAGLRDLFKTTLNKLMTSEIRVNDLDIDVSEVDV